MATQRNRTALDPAQCGFELGALEATRQRAGRRGRGLGARAGAQSTAAVSELDGGERIQIVDTFLTVIGGAYCHLPQKRARYATDPVQALQLLRTRAGDLQDAEFHLALMSIVTRLRDAHTRYAGPSSMRGHIATLPFLVEQYGPHDSPTFIASKVGPIELVGDKRFVEGVVLEYLNGVPFARAVDVYADHETGGRADARRARALESLTFRSLQYGPPPDELWVDVGFRTARGKAAEVRIPWRVVAPGPSPLAHSPGSRASRYLASNLGAEQVRRAKKLMFSNALWQAETRAVMVPTEPAAAMAGTAGIVRAASRVASRTSARATARAAAARRPATAPSAAPPSAADSAPEAAMPVAPTAAPPQAAVARDAGWVPTSFQDALAARTVRVTGIGEIGYLRVWSFDLDDDDAFLAEVVRLLALLPARGLILDLRGNPGGLIWAAERMLQLFTPRPITPVRFSLVASPLTRAMVGNPFNRLELQAWEASLQLAVSTGEPYSQPLPLTDPAWCNDIGQQYLGPVVCIADPNTYSAGDIFVAGFVDHEIGPLICVGEATGAGGANVWTHHDMREALADTPYALPPMQGDAGYTLAIRRVTRAGPAEGLPLEDVGVRGIPYAMTQRDLLGDNEDLIAYCASYLTS